MRMRVRSLILLSGLRIQCCHELQLGHQCGSDPVLLWPWSRLAAAAPIQPITWEPPYATGAALKRPKKKFFSLKYFLGYTYNEKVSIIYLWLELIWASCVLSCSNIWGKWAFHSWVMAPLHVPGDLLPRWERSMERTHRHRKENPRTIREE